MQTLFFSAYCPCRCLLIKIRKVGGAVRGLPPRDVRQRNRTSFKLNAGGKSEIFFFLNHFLFQDQSSSSGVAVHIKSWVSWSYCPVTSFSLDKFRGGYHNVCCFSVNHFLYNFIYIHEYIRTSFSVRSFFYFGDTGGIFCSLPACLWPPWGELRRACGWRL